VGRGLVPRDAITVGLELQPFLKLGLITLTRASSMLKQCVSAGISLAVLAETTRSFADPDCAPEAIDLLRKLELISQQDLQTAESAASKFAMGPLSALLYTNRIRATLFQAALHLGKLVRERKLSLQEAVAKLELCERTGDRIEVVLAPQLPPDSSGGACEIQDDQDAESLRSQAEFNQVQSVKHFRSCLVGMYALLIGAGVLLWAVCPLMPSGVQPHAPSIAFVLFLIALAERIRAAVHRARQDAEWHSQRIRLACKNVTPSPTQSLRAL
jgi:hypothetical protein